jgi:iron complex transport system substrate-binding protein
LLADVRVVSLAPRTLTDVWVDVGRVAAAIDREDEGRVLLATLTTRLRSLRGETEGAVLPTVACIEWLEPLMMAGNWMAELVDAAGGRYPFAQPGAASGAFEWSALVATQPDAIVLMPCGFDVAQTVRELERVRARPEWSALRAVADGRAVVVDGNAYFNRPGPRLVESAEILAAFLHPAHCGRRMVPGAALEVAP